MIFETLTLLVRFGTLTNWDKDKSDLYQSINSSPVALRPYVGQKLSQLEFLYNTPLKAYYRLRWICVRTKYLNRLRYVYRRCPRFPISSGPAHGLRIC